MRPEKPEIPYDGPPVNIYDYIINLSFLRNVLRNKYLNVFMVYFIRKQLLLRCLSFFV